MVYHRDWAKARSDFTEARRLEEEIVSAEAVRIDCRNRLRVGPNDLDPEVD